MADIASREHLPSASLYQAGRCVKFRTKMLGWRIGLQGTKGMSVLCPPEETFSHDPLLDYLRATSQRYGMRSVIPDQDDDDGRLPYHWQCHRVSTSAMVSYIAWRIGDREGEILLATVCVREHNATWATRSSLVSREPVRRTISRICIHC